MKTKTAASPSAERCHRCSTVLKAGDCPMCNPPRDKSMTKMETCNRCGYSKPKNEQCYICRQKAIGAL